MGLTLYNALTRQEEPFEPVVEGQVGLYVCGPTVQDYAHLGHAKSYTTFDIVVRWLRHEGYEVLYVQNLTDVGHLLDSGEDRILKKARETQAEPMQIAEYYIRSYFEDMDALGIKRPDISPRASGHIPEQIATVQTLIKKGHAYVTEKGSVYFDVSTYPEYGKLSGRRVEELRAGTREDVREEKDDPADFAIWKHAEPEHILRWDSPWGEGFPGWHIECSAMSAKYLGETFDIHGGGVDNIFPHNEDEIAQSECAHDAPYARYWMLVGSLTVDGVKMSKSLGNFWRIKDALQHYPAEALRTFVLSGHYRKPADFSRDALDSAQQGWERIAGAVQLLRETLRTSEAGGAGQSDAEALVTEHAARFTEAMNADFNMPQALAVMQDFTREVNAILNGDSAVGRAALEALDGFYREYGGGVLGIVPEKAASSADAEREAGIIRLLIDIRKEARANKDWATADTIRDRLAELGISLLDRADGTTWRIS